MNSLKAVEDMIARIEDIDPNDPRLVDLNELADDLAEREVQVQEAFKVNQAARELKQRELAFKERITSKVGNYLEWMTWAESLYPITCEAGVFTVTSTAREWKEPVVWSYPTKIDCLEQIERLIGYKINDRNRGHGDMSNDLKEIV